MDEEDTVVIAIRKSATNGRIFVTISDDNKDKNRRYLTSSGKVTISWGGDRDYFPSYRAALEVIQSLFVILEEIELDVHGAIVATLED
jgi:hypothetical protein